MISPPRRPLTSAFFERPAPVVAADLVGCSLTVDGVGGRIVETEAYAADDPASHSFNGPTRRNQVMFGPAGRAYVYRIYGLHWCLNLTCGGGAAVLIRALEPMIGQEVMMARRGVSRPEALCSGPGKVCQALAVDDRFNGLAVTEGCISVADGGPRPTVVAGSRIGIRRAVDIPWRFCAEASPWLSRR